MFFPSQGWLGMCHWSLSSLGIWAKSDELDMKLFKCMCHNHNLQKKIWARFRVNTSAPWSLQEEKFQIYRESSEIEHVASFPRIFNVSTPNSLWWLQHKSLNLQGMASWRENCTSSFLKVIWSYRHIVYLRRVHPKFSSGPVFISIQAFAFSVAMTPYDQTCDGPEKIARIYLESWITLQDVVLRDDCLVNCRFENWCFSSPPVRWGLLHFMSDHLFFLLHFLFLHRTSRQPRSPLPAFPAGPQPGSCTASAPCQTVTASLRG